MPYLYAILAAVVILAAVLLGRTAAFRSRRYTVEPEPGIEIDVEKAAKRLSGAIKIPTITASDPKKADRAPFKQFIDYLEQAFPAAHKLWSGRSSTATVSSIVGKGATKASSPYC